MAMGGTAVWVVLVVREAMVEPVATAPPQVSIMARTAPMVPTAVPAKTVPLAGPGIRAGMHGPGKTPAVAWRFPAAVAGGAVAKAAAAEEGLLRFAHGGELTRKTQISVPKARTALTGSGGKPEVPAMAALLHTPALDPRRGWKVPLLGRFMPARVATAVRAATAATARAALVAVPAAQAAAVPAAR